MSKKTPEENHDQPQKDSVQPEKAASTPETQAANPEAVKPEETKATVPPTKPKGGAFGAMQIVVLLLIVGMVLSAEYWRGAVTATMLSPIFGAPDQAQQQARDIMRAEMNALQEQMLRNMTKLQEVEEHSIQQQTEGAEVAEGLQQTQRQADIEFAATKQSLQLLRDQLASLEVALETAQDSLTQQTRTDQDNTLQQGHSLRAAETQSSLVRMNVEIAALGEQLHSLSRVQDSTDGSIADLYYWARVSLKLGALGKAITRGEPFTMPLIAFGEGLNPAHRGLLREQLSGLDAYAANGLISRKALRREVRAMSSAPMNVLENVMPEISAETPAEGSTGLEAVGQRMMDELRGLVKIRRLEPNVVAEQTGQGEGVVAELLRRQQQEPENIALQQLVEQAIARQSAMETYRQIRAWFQQQAWQE